MKRLIIVLVALSFLLALFSCTETSDLTSNSDDVSSKIGSETVLIKLKGRIDFEDGSYLESYDKERFFEIPVDTEKLRELKEELLSKAACSGETVVFFTGNLVLSGMSSVNFYVSSTTVTNWCNPYDHFKFKPRVHFTTSSSCSFNFNSNLKKENESTVLWSGNTDGGASSSGSYYVDGHYQVYSKQCGEFGPDTFVDLNVDIFNDDTSPFTINSVLTFITGEGPQCAL